MVVFAYGGRLFCFYIFMTLLLFHSRESRVLQVGITRATFVARAFLTHGTFRIIASVVNG